MNGSAITANVNWVAENAYLKLVGRAAIPIVGSLILWILTDIRSETDKTKQYLEHVSEQISSTHTDLEVTKEDLKQYRERQDDIRKALEDSIRNLD
ncbi:MAG TPA: hypothetical protein VGT08_01740, partial [Terracidiphilus sp.]|nr:hypothetical protein [Terracidiphilus sp.]